MEILMPSVGWLHVRPSSCEMVTDARPCFGALEGRPGQPMSPSAVNIAPPA